MSQIHRRFTDEQVRMLFQGYCQGQLARSHVQELLDIGKSRFFALLKAYRLDPEGFSVAYRRASPAKLSLQAEDAVKAALLREKAIVEDPDLPISGYNYTAMRDRLEAMGIKVSVTTIIDRARKLDCHKPRRKRKVHCREVLTAAIGELIQHDGSTHLWCPLAKEKWTLITSIDDYSRKVLFADFFGSESTWAHIQATQALIQQYGLPQRYYVDSLRVFRFVQGRDSFWRDHVLETDDVDTQWGKIMCLLGVKVSHALSPQAKGKVERPYRWLQDRIVRTCIYENLSTKNRSSGRPPNRTPSLQQPTGPFNHRRDPQHPLRAGQKTGQFIVPQARHSRALCPATGCVLPTGKTHGQCLPPHLPVQPCDRSAPGAPARIRRHPYGAGRHGADHAPSYLVERQYGTFALTASGHLPRPYLIPQVSTFQLYRCPLFNFS
jgi:hypothetical protein